jgi:hypothetical protein
MKRINIFVLTVVGALWFPSCGNDVDLASKLWAELDLSAVPNTLTVKEKKAGWQLLFDGKTTNGWHGYNMQGIPDVWATEDGCIVVNGVGGGEEQDVITDGVYRNFAFTVEYKLSVGSNSGIIYQVKEDAKYQYPYETGPEFQLLDDSNRPPERRLPGLQSHGANYGMYAPASQPYHPAGEWNRLLIVVNGNHVTHTINGVEVVNYEKYSDEWLQLRDSGKWADFPDYGKFDEGHISLQNHGSKLWFRNIKIKQL